MRQVGMMALVLFASLALASARLDADEPKGGDAKAENKLIGTWKLTSAKYGGEEATLDGETTTIKHVTPSQFMWLTYDKEGKIIRTSGGRYTIKEDTYEEMPEYGIGPDFEAIKGQTHTFKWKVEGTKWHHNGMLSGGLTIDEVWERVEVK